MQSHCVIGSETGDSLSHEKVTISESSAQIFYSQNAKACFNCLFPLERGSFMRYEVLESNETYQGKILRVTIDKIEMPDGKAAFRETVIRDKSAAAVLPIMNDGKLLFVRQYRHAFAQSLLEIPAGVLNDCEVPEFCIRRELEEETGYSAGKMEYLCEIYPTVGFCSETIFLYFAYDLTEGEQKLDPDEFIELESYTLEQALDMVYTGEIKDAKTIVALFAYKSKHN